MIGEATAGKPNIEDKPERPARPLVKALLILLLTLSETGR
jgi:hypothetical protein